MDLKFPEVLHVSHYDHSSEESPSLNACLKQHDAVRDDEPSTLVAEYKLVRVLRLAKKVEELPL
jgi:hypothetical protein